MTPLSELKVGVKVKCPARRGKKAHTAEVIWIEESLAQPKFEKNYRWIKVRDEKGKEDLWPSNRVSLEAP